MKSNVAETAQINRPHPDGTGKAGESRETPGGVIVLNPVFQLGVRCSSDVFARISHGTTAVGGRVLLLLV
jgi:hypothetical protein